MWRRRISATCPATQTPESGPQQKAGLGVRKEEVPMPGLGPGTLYPTSPWLSGPTHPCLHSFILSSVSWARDQVRDMPTVSGELSLHCFSVGPGRGPSSLCLAHLSQGLLNNPRPFLPFQAQPRQSPFQRDPNSFSQPWFPHLQLGR